METLICLDVLYTQTNSAHAKKHCSWTHTLTDTVKAPDNTDDSRELLKASGEHLPLD